MSDFIDILETIVDDMRATGDIINITEATGKSTIESVNTFKAKEVVSMDNVHYIILSATPTEFIVSGVGITATEWKAKAPYYEHDTPTQIINTLLFRDSDDSLRYQKYPLIYLVLNIKEDHDKNNEFIEVLKEVTILILTKTEMKYVARERKANVFEPILHPLTSELINAIKNSLYLSNSRLEFTKEDNYFWGTKQQAGNSKNILNDPIDAVELKLKDLKIIKNCHG